MVRGKEVKFGSAATTWKILWKLMKKTGLLYNTEYNSTAIEVGDEFKYNKYFITMTKLRIDVDSDSRVLGKFRGMLG